MASRVFISFAMEDKGMVDGLRLLGKNPDYDLEFYDESVRQAIDSENAKYIKEKIRGKIERSGVILCFVGPKTSMSEWVKWELSEGIRLEKAFVAMACKGVERATLPEPIRNIGVPFGPWNPGELNRNIREAVFVRKP